MLLHCHEACFRAWWRWRSRAKGGRPRISRALISLIRRISRENPLWGAPRIHGELLKLGFTLAQSTVSKYMPLRRGRPTQSWTTFLHQHADAIAAMLTVRTLTFECLYAFVVLAHGRRNILHIEVTAHPTALWLTNQITEAFPWDTAPKFLIRDNDGAYGPVLRRRVWAMGIGDRPTRPYSPWMNSYAERLIGSIRRDCLDHMIVLNADHLRHVLRDYADYYNNDRTHLGLGKDTPNTRPCSVRTPKAIQDQPFIGHPASNLTGTRKQPDNYLAITWK